MADIFSKIGLKIGLTKAAIAKWGLIALLPWPIILIVLAYYGIKAWANKKKQKSVPGESLPSLTKDQDLKSSDLKSTLDDGLASNHMTTEKNIGPLCQEKEFLPLENPIAIK